MALCVSLHAVAAQTTAVPITRDSIGALPLQLPLSEVAQRYRAGPRVAWHSDGSEEVGYPVRPCRYAWLIIGFGVRPITARGDGTIAPSRLPAAARPSQFRVHPRDTAAASHPRCLGA